MKPIFVGTSALIAIGNTRDAFHQTAATLLKDMVIAQNNFVTTNAVILEFANAFSRAEHKRLAIRVLDLIEENNGNKRSELKFKSHSIDKEEIEVTIVIEGNPE